MTATLSQDFIFAARQFRRNLGFTTTVVLTLALCIGATTAIFSLVDGVLLRPLPYPQADRLIAVDTLEFPAGNPTMDPAAASGVATSYPDYFDWRQQNHTFESLVSYDDTTRLFSKANGEGARVIHGARVSANLFSTLGVMPAVGRSFLAEEEVSGNFALILSHEIWVSDFASSPHAIGQIVKISDRSYTVVGVMPKGFHYPVGEPALWWSTYGPDAEGKSPNILRRDWQRVAIIGRLKPGVKMTEAQADLNTIQQGLAQHYAEIKDWR